MPGNQHGAGTWKQLVLDAIDAAGGAGSLQEILQSYLALRTPAELAKIEASTRKVALRTMVSDTLSRLLWDRRVTNSQGVWRYVACGEQEQVPVPLPKYDVFDGPTILAKAQTELDIDLGRLVAATAIWAPIPQGMIVKNPDCRRARKGEPVRTWVDGVWLDDNTKANLAIKVARGGRKNFTGFTACHVWPDTCYEVLYHTRLANLVLIPSGIFSLSDHDKHVEACLKFRAFELFGWYPGRESEDLAKEPANPPVEPDRYPDNWR